MRGTGLDGDAFLLSVVADGAPLLSEPVDASVFDTGVARERFVTAAARHIALREGEADADAAEEAAAAVTAALDEFQERYPDGRLHVADHAPSNSSARQPACSSTPTPGEWTVLFDREGYSNRLGAYCGRTSRSPRRSGPRPTRRSRRSGAASTGSAFGISVPASPTTFSRTQMSRGSVRPLAGGPAGRCGPGSPSPLRTRSPPWSRSPKEEHDYLHRPGQVDVNAEVGPVQSRTLKQVIRVLGLADQLEDVDAED